MSTAAELPEEKRFVYELILRQLVLDGFSATATTLSQALKVAAPKEVRNEPGNRLTRLVQLGLEKERDATGKAVPSGVAAPEDTGRPRSYDPEYEAKAGPPVRRHPNFQTKFITTHKNAVRCVKFSPDGKYVATGSADTSIKMMDVRKMKAFNQSADDDMAHSVKPVIRTFYDHTQPVNDFSFHPTQNVLASCAKDQTIKFYDYTHPHARRSFRTIQDTSNVRSVCFHPSGDFLISGADHPTIRLYDVNTLQCFAGSRPDEFHTGPVTQVRYSPEGNMYASCSKDGAVKIWDAVSNRVINTIPKAHQGAEPTTLQFSKNQRYMLTGGKDASISIWELSSGRQLQRIFSGAAWKYRLQATFNYTEDFILTTEESTFSVLVWDARSGEMMQRLGGHSNVISWLAASPVSNDVVTASMDHRARFWAGEG
eukprot:TRINITY_DN26945_c0_g1_i1.p1 TRINITY_DN26945_c0_g1~~TRINITY_DN26945_c0_g1_i1.p1  ORF type:complete len:426 (-),score=126.07 TRINITY_DN26945_c0_g1_i1:142-1419(-)